MAEKSLTPDDSLTLAVRIVSAYVSNHKIDQCEIVSLLKEVHKSTLALAFNRPLISPGMKPAVPVSKSVTNDHIICLEDGKKLRMLKRYLKTHYNLSPDEYRAKWGLPADYPMTAPSYSKKRSKLAKEGGLGRSPNQKRGRKSTRQKKENKQPANTPQAAERMIAQSVNGRRVLPTVSSAGNI